MSWDQHFAQRTKRMKSSAIRELLKVTERADIISFAGGLPAPEVFPIETIATFTQQVLRDNGPQALQYSATEGYLPLRTLLAQQTSQHGLHVTTDNLVITSGSQQALDLLGKILLDPGDLILVEEPTYMGALQAWSSYEPQYVALPIDEHGIVLDHLEEALQRHPSFMYIQPNFQNPGGVSLSLERRQRLVELAARYDVLIIEDDPYGRLQFEGETVPTLLQLDSARREQAPYQGNVIRLNTFSKVLAPGWRLGWVTAAPQIITKIVQAKQGVDLQTPTFTQMIAYEIMKTGFLEQHIPFIQEVYRQHRDIMLEALQKYFPSDATWTYPSGGMFLWITLPAGSDATAILREAVKRGVAFVPGADFHACGGGENTFRLNFSNATPDNIRTGIARLGEVLQESQVAL